MRVSQGYLQVVLFLSAYNIGVNFAVNEKSPYKVVAIFANYSKIFSVVDVRENIAVENAATAQKQVSGLRKLHY